MFLITSNDHEREQFCSLPVTVTDENERNLFQLLIKIISEEQFFRKFILIINNYQ